MTQSQEWLHAKEKYWLLQRSVNGVNIYCANLLVLHASLLYLCLGCKVTAKGCIARVFRLLFEKHGYFLTFCSSFEPTSHSKTAAFFHDYFLNKLLSLRAFQWTRNHQTWCRILPPSPRWWRQLVVVGGLTSRLAFYYCFDYTFC